MAADALALSGRDLIWTILGVKQRASARTKRRVWMQRGVLYGDR
jgi:hypothetical protein